MDVVDGLTKIGFLGRLPPEIANAIIGGSRLVHYPARALTFVGDIRYVFRGELLGAIRK